MQANILIKSLMVSTLFLSQLTLSGCGAWWLPRAHKIEIQQGNVLPDEAVARIVEGMTRSEVIGILGEPVVSNPKNSARWDYIYSVNRSGDSPNAKRVTLIFENDRVATIEKDGFS
jgi:outer membrane protein assembly factor BamE